MKRSELGSGGTSPILGFLHIERHDAIFGQAELVLLSNDSGRHVTTPRPGRLRPVWGIESLETLETLNDSRGRWTLDSSLSIESNSPSLAFSPPLPLSPVLVARLVFTRLRGTSGDISPRI